MPRILVINPNTTVAVTDLVLARCRAVALSGTELVGATGAFGAAYIASEAAFAIAGHAALQAYAEHGAGCDAVLLACFGDPGLFALREIAPVPVVALADASMAAAAARGRFAIVTGGARWAPMLERLAAQLGYADQLVRVHTVAPTGGQIAADPEAAIALLANACAEAASEAGVASVILGGAGLAGLATRVQPSVAVPVLDSVEAGMRAVERAAASAMSARSAGSVHDARFEVTPAPSAQLDPALARLLTG